MIGTQRQGRTARGRRGYLRQRYDVRMPPHRPSIADAPVRKFIQEYMRRRSEAGETVERIAQDLGLSKTQVINAKNDGTKIGPKTQNAVATKAFGGSIDRLRAAADEHWEKIPSSERIGLTLADQDPELAAAVAFLRGQLDDEHLDAWLKSNSDVGWKGVTRDEFVAMIRASAIRARVSATEDLERARTAHLSSPGHDATTATKRRQGS